MNSKLIILIGLLTMPVMAQDFKFKNSIDLDGNLDIGTELQLQSDNPNGLGVLGLDLDTKHLLPIFNFGYNYKFKRVEMLTYLGFGMRDVRACSDSVISTTSNNGNGNGNNGNHGQGNNGNGNGNNGNGKTTTTNTISTTCIDNREVYHEIGLRFVPRIGSNIKPLIEFSTLSTGLDYEEKIKFGIITDF